jgi:hypothetical protein
MQVPVSNYESLVTDWQTPNTTAQEALDGMVHLLNVAIAHELNADRRYWLEQSRKNLKSAATFLLRTNSALNAAGFHS